MRLNRFVCFADFVVYPFVIVILFAVSLRQRTGIICQRFRVGPGFEERHREDRMKFRPLHDRVVVKRIDAEEKTKGGIIIPGTDESPSPCLIGERSADLQIFGRFLAAIRDDLEAHLRAFLQAGVASLFQRRDVDIRRCRRRPAE